MKILIAISGKLGSGKDYIANNLIAPIISKRWRYLHTAFADQLKVNVMTTHNISYHEVYEKKTHTTRKLLQHEGTEVARNHDEDIWIKYLENWVTIHNHRGIECFIVTDMRFKNEYSYISSVKNSGEVGFTIKIIGDERNKSRLLQESGGNDEIYKNISTHQSECDLDNIDNFDMVINNDSHFNLQTYSEMFVNLLDNKINETQSK